MLFSPETMNDWLTIGLICMHGFWVFVWLGGRSARRESILAHRSINAQMEKLQKSIEELDTLQGKQKDALHQLSELSVHIINNLDRLEKMGPERVRQLLEQLLQQKS